MYCDLKTNSLFLPPQASDLSRMGTGPGFGGGRPVPVDVRGVVRGIGGDLIEGGDGRGFVGILIGSIIIDAVGLIVDRLGAGFRFLCCTGTRWNNAGAGGTPVDVGLLQPRPGGVDVVPVVGVHDGREGMMAWGGLWITITTVVD